MEAPQTVLQKFSQLLHSDPLTLRVNDLPNHPFNCFFIKSGFRNQQSAIEMANVFMDDTSAVIEMVHLYLYQLCKQIEKGDSRIASVIIGPFSESLKIIAR